MRRDRVMEEAPVTVKLPLTLPLSPGLNVLKRAAYSDRAVPPVTGRDLQISRLRQRTADQKMHQINSRRQLYGVSGEGRDAFRCVHCLQRQRETGAWNRRRSMLLKRSELDR